MRTRAASDIEMDPSNPDVLYACLWGRARGRGRTRIRIGGAGGGIFKSTDGGNTWHNR